MCQCQGKSCCSTNECGCRSSNGSSCACQSSGCGCQSKKNCDCGCKKCGCNYISKFLELADCAWMEVLKEKIKENIRSSGKNLDELARIISEANHERWQKKMEGHKCSTGFEEKLGEFFCQSCQTKK